MQRCAFSPFSGNGIRRLLPVHSDRIAEDLHLIPYYLSQNESTRKVVYSVVCIFMYSIVPIKIDYKHNIKQKYSCIEQPAYSILPKEAGV